jgi:cystathionine beta-synthase
LIDHFEKVTDKDAALMTREIPRQEAIFVGNSAGSAIAGIRQMKDTFKEDDVVVVIFHDHGTRYLGKMYNDDWMRAKGYLDISGFTAKDLVLTSSKSKLLTIESSKTVDEAIKMMSQHDISQMPVTHQGRIVGSINEDHLFDLVVQNPQVKMATVENIMLPALPFVDISTPIDSLSKMIAQNNTAVMVRDFKTDENFIITKHDVVNALTK